MRFYMLPEAEGKTTFINFDHVTSVSIHATGVEISILGLEAPLMLPKNAPVLTTVSKGMDLSDSSKELVNKL